MIGEKALAGVGATTSLYNLFVTAIVGFTSGVSVLFAQQYGRGEDEENGKLLSLYALLSGAISLFVSVLGMIFTAPVLRALRTPDDLFAYAKEYLIVIFIGIPFLAVYNTYSAALRGVGNSRVPFISVLLSSVINGVLDYTFIGICSFGVWSAAAATVISQIVMTVYVIVFAEKHYPSLKFSKFHMREWRSTIRKGGKYAVPPAVQSSVTSVGNLFLQRFMNTFGEPTVAAVTTAYRVDSVLLLPIVNFSTAISTIVAQETGAGNEKNAKKEFHIGTGMMAIISAGLTAVIILAGKTLLSMFGLTGTAVAIGDQFFKTISLFYVSNGVAMSIKGYLEGTSDMLFSGIAGICSLGVRIVCSYLFEGVFDNMVIAYAEAFSWIFLLFVFAMRYLSKRNG
jgi:putative MATE family efflux protein